MKVKLCGLSRMEDIRYVNEFGPDYVGFVFAKSRRQVTIVQAATLRKALAASIQAVGVFVNETLETVARIARDVSLNAVQLHGDEDAAYIARLRALLPPGTNLWKAVRVQKESDLHHAQRYGADWFCSTLFPRTLTAAPEKPRTGACLGVFPRPGPFFWQEAYTQATSGKPPSKSVRTGWTCPAESRQTGSRTGKKSNRFYQS